MSTEKAEQQPVIVVLCGPSHAGKTTFAQKISKISARYTGDTVPRNLDG
jgi:uridine kinase